MTPARIYKPSALRLIDAGERLIGRHGLDGVSLQQIAAEAGQANKFAVQYHFGSKQGLVEAIFAVRLPRIDERRRQLYDGLKAQGDVGIHALIWALVGPVIDEVDAYGEHAYARFAAQIRDLPNERRFWRAHAVRATVTEVVEELRLRTPHLARIEFDLRISLIIDIFLGAMRLMDGPEDVVAVDDPWPLEQAKLLDQALAMSAGALSCPAEGLPVSALRSAGAPRAGAPAPAPGTPGRS